MIDQIIGGKYKIVRQIGGGGMGNVYEAVHVGTGRRVALKLIITAELAKNPVLVGRFQREAKAVGGIETDHIVQVLDTGIDDQSELPYMVMEFLEGEDVQQLVRRVGPLSQDLALRIIAQACLGLGKAHDAGVVHRDVKPANLYLAKRDEGARIVKLLDFGIAKVKMEQAQSAESAGLTRTGSMLGSPLYMSPEQARGQKGIDHRADIWSLGVVLYEVLAGRTPFHHIEALGELIIAICAETPPPVQEFAPWVNAEVARVISRAMRIDPSQRYQTVHEMFDAVKQLLPSGHALEESMLRPMSMAEKATVAARYQPSVSEAMAAPPAYMPRASMPPTGAAQTPIEGQLTTGGAGAVATPVDTGPVTTMGGAHQRGMGPLLGLMAVGVLGVGGVVVWQATKQKDPGPAAPQVTTVVQIVKTVEPAPAASVAPAPADTSPRTVTVVCLPDDAKVEVDDKEVTSRKGLIDVSGALGSKHKVVLRKGKREKTEWVAITDSGAVPPKIELDAPTGGGAGPATSAKAGDPPKPPGGGPSVKPIDTTFN